MPEIGPDEMHVVTLFLNLSTQWLRAGMAGVRTGINYGVVPQVAGMLGFAADAALLADLRVMEDAALVQMAARA